MDCSSLCLCVSVALDLAAPHGLLQPPANVCWLCPSSCGAVLVLLTSCIFVCLLHFVLHFVPTYLR